MLDFSPTHWIYSGNILFFKWITNTKEKCNIFVDYSTTYVQQSWKLSSQYSCIITKNYLEMSTECNSYYFFWIHFIFNLELAEYKEFNFPGSYTHSILFCGLILNFLKDPVLRWFASRWHAYFYMLEILYIISNMKVL